MNSEDKGFIIYGGQLFDGVDRVYENGAVYILNGKIVAAGEEGDVFKSVPSNSRVEYYDTGGKIIFPGLINLHHHFYSALSVGLPFRGPYRNFHDRLEKLWWKLDKALDKEIIQLSALVSIMDSIKSGVIIIFDHHSSPFDIKGSLETISSVVTRSGIKSVLCYELSDRDGKYAFERGLEENLDFIERHKEDKHTKGILGVHANFTLSEDSMLKISKHFRPEVGIHIHCAEDLIDVKYCREHGYRGPVDRLKRYNLLSDKSILAHCVHVSEEEIDTVKSHKAIIACNPESNMNNRVGIFKIPVKEGITVGMGTDGMGSDMLLTARTAYLSYLQFGVDENIIFENIRSFILKNNRVAASRFFGSGVNTLKPGADADIVVFNYTPLSPLSNDNLPSHLIFGMYNSQASMVMVNGKIIYNNGLFLTLDEEMIKYEAKRASERLWKKFLTLC